MDKIFAWAQKSSPKALVTYDVDVESEAYRVKVVPALTDNYQYVVIDKATNEAVAVDVSDAPSIIETCAKEGAVLVGVLTTHYHADHSGGNLELCAAINDLVVVAGDGDFARCPGATTSVKDGEALTIAGITFSCIATPGHTRGHTAFYLPGVVFTGDVLFQCGCGRIMEGDAATMRASLNKLAALPGPTRVLCGHEYALANFKFAFSLDPNNPEVKQRLDNMLLGGTTPDPSTIAEELTFNPFLRTGGDDAAFASIRRKKDTFTNVGTVITYALDLASVFSSQQRPETLNNADMLLRAATTTDTTNKQ